MMEQSSLSEVVFDHRNDLSDAKSVDSAFSIDSVGGTTQEVFEHDLSSITAEKLFNELQRVKEDLKSKDDEVRRANELRENTDQEIQELTASLFESAHAMVEQAKYAQANAEQKLQVSNQTMDALILENTHLKKSVSELKQILNSCRKSSPVSNNHNSIDNMLLREFTCWDEKPSIERDGSLFMYRVYNEDILPCVTFPNAALSTRVLEAIERNDVVMEKCHSTETMKMCSLMGEICECDYRVRLDENNQWYPLSRLARNRIASICDFFTFIRHVQSGLVKSDTLTRFNKIIELRKQMTFARLGL
ncbi:unnamed protein product [Adineta steineri]|uniref:GDP/GTP exchange factor Sec2 N-terminal domain-containing protein n=1 Tax=Adineta steineri TaxID=433720 RepID=A0A814ED51_9BILA|nr:unnamed protein product [Adineta steineri]CAF0967623.1 unnamed protein product [Adineta steineri]CAF3697028.1 unnamed protein product [Adineta steineri]